MKDLYKLCILATAVVILAFAYAFLIDGFDYTKLLLASIMTSIYSSFCFLLSWDIEKMRATKK
jgi:uncharacterized membrane protein (DUF106 family)